MEKAEEEFRAFMKCQVKFGHWTVLDMHDYITRLRDELILEVVTND